MRWILLFAFVFLPNLASPQSTCEGAQACVLGERSYHVREPDGWDGVTPLPVLIHFHGWGRQGDLVVNHGRIASATRKRGVLLVAPNGQRKTWDFWRAGSDDVAFARAVLEDVAWRYPVDGARVFVSGYSWGANMAWRFVCDDGADVTALLAMSGTLRQDETCATAPQQVRQVFGLKDQVLPYPYGPKGEVEHAVRLWRDQYGCGQGAMTGEWQQRPFLTLTRYEWSTCSEGFVALDTHPGGHFIPHGWIARHLDELMGLPFSYP